MNISRAFAFVTDLSLDQLFERLNAAGPWRWSRRDSEHYGDYLSTRALPDYAMLKVFVEPRRYVLNLQYRSKRPDGAREVDELVEILLNKVFPAIGAREVAPTETYD